MIKENGRTNHKQQKGIRPLLVAYDVALFAVVCLFLLLLHPSMESGLSGSVILITLGLGLVFVIVFRIAWDVYLQIWRYGQLTSYMRLILADLLACAAHTLINKVFVSQGPIFSLLVTIYVLNLVLCILCRMSYAVLYQQASEQTKTGTIAKNLLRIFGNIDVNQDLLSLNTDAAKEKIRLAVFGAGRVGMGLVEDMKASPVSIYLPVCFVDNNPQKIGKYLSGLPVYSQEEFSSQMVEQLDLQEIIIAIPNKALAEKSQLVEKLLPLGCRVKVYDYPVASEVRKGKLTLREYSIEELLPRRMVSMNDDDTRKYYQGKVVLITGGGGSIGSELSRQVASMHPKKLILLDIAENTTYDIQQELRAKYRNALDLCVEISSVSDEPAMRKIFDTYHPQIVLHAAAHKHVPLMEHNCVEAVKNNIFGTNTVVNLCEEYQVEKFVLVSTDKAVNPTNVMGATKRFCEYIALSHNFACAVRFGNVMGSAGSVIPLFKKQISVGGPVTITDVRITRFFMTITEASRLILESGAKADSGELYVLDMGQPVKILNVAEKMISLSGYKPYKDIDIVEIGLRPGEKLYEELLMESATLSKTDNELIFIEKDEKVPQDLLQQDLEQLKAAVQSEDDNRTREVLKEVVPTFKSPEEVNRKVDK